MKAYLRFLWSVAKHKWYVLIAGRRLKVPLWRLLTHDLSKLTFAEFGPYARHFYGGEIDPRDFTPAWHFHKLRNDHHWENWVSAKGNTKYRAAIVGEEGDKSIVLISDDGPVPMKHYPLTVPTVLVLPMPMICVREMVADWFAAGRAYNGSWPDPNNYKWYKANRPKMRLHPTTEMRIGLVLAEAARWEWK